MLDQADFIPWDCLLSATASVLDQIIPGWRVIETLAPVPTEVLETGEALQEAS
jgi:hypothetical protein